MIDPTQDERLTAYLDGELSPQETAAMEDELSRNPRMYELVAEMRVVRELLRRVADEDAPKGLYQRVMNTIDMDTAHRRGTLIPGGMGVPIVLIMLAAGFLMVLNQAVTSLQNTARLQAAAPPPVVQVVPAPPPMPPDDKQPYFMAPDAYRFIGPGSFEAVKNAAASVGASLVDPQGEPMDSPNEKGEIWIAIDAAQIRPFRYAMEGQTRIETIGIPRMVDGKLRLRLLIQEVP